jgi:hypothetical protein
MADSSSGGKGGGKAPMAPLVATPPRRTFLYTPFGAAAMDSALGENMVRVAKGKQAHALIGPSEAEANHMEVQRQTTLATWKQKLNVADNSLRRHHNTVVSGGYTHKMRMRQIAHDRALNAEQRSAAVVAEKERHAASVPIGHIMAQADKALYGPKFQALQQTEIANATVNVRVEDTPAHPQWPNLFPAKRTVTETPKLYPSLYDSTKPLSRVQPKDKLYVLGHSTGATEDLPRPGLYAFSNIPGPSLSARGMVEHMRDAGLPKDFEDLRVTACQGVPLLPENGPGAVAATRNSGHLAPEISREASAHFPNMSVTGYMGNGVTFPFGSDHHLREDPTTPGNRGDRKPLAVKFPPLKE